MKFLTATVSFLLVSSCTITQGSDSDWRTSCHEFKKFLTNKEEVYGTVSPANPTDNSANKSPYWAIKIRDLDIPIPQSDYITPTRTNITNRVHIDLISRNKDVAVSISIKNKQFCTVDAHAPVDWDPDEMCIDHLKSGYTDFLKLVPVAFKQSTNKLTCMPENSKSQKRVLRLLLLKLSIEPIISEEGTGSFYFFNTPEDGYIVKHFVNGSVRWDVHTSSNKKDIIISYRFSNKIVDSYPDFGLLFLEPMLHSTTTPDFLHHLSTNL